ncbi:MAG: pyruvate dehydrogenase (acetyl-transferring) E1 component subunit alpha [Phycisphaerales bacterium]|nr:pyruvate dehydrogenase (acetyl-transferring) E1 component subunit alpha [Phycisphaerales bacterium]
MTSSSTPSTQQRDSEQVPIPGPDVLLKWLRDMMLIREFEVRAMQAYQNKLAGGFLHVYNGQEAVAVGTIAALKSDDPVITAYRDHGHALARGLDPKVGMAELFGRIGGCAKGKGGSMHFFDAPNHMYGGHGIVGAQTPLGAGLAFATKYEDEVIRKRPNSRVTLCFLGDGALNQGAFHEAANLAKVMDIPVIFIVENNQYAMGTSIERCTSAAGNLVHKAVAYDMDAITVDGMDVIKTYRDMKALVDDIRETPRPAFVDMHCYRFKGHSMSDPRKYRTHEEEQENESNDPIDGLSKFLVKTGVLEEAAIKTMSKEVRTEIRAAVKWAEASPEPDISELYHDVYVDTWGPYTGTSLPEFMRDSSKEKS